MKKIINSKIFLVIITMIICISGTLYAAKIYYATDVIYNPSTGESMSVNDALNDLYKKCTPFSSKVKIGDYISMTPASTSFTTDTSKTGYTSTQTINPSELNLWRVIKINDNGTIEVVSEYVSSVSIYFSGQIGYQYLVGYLNEIASQYENNKYTTGSRIMGYNSQTEYITDTSKLTSTTAPWTSDTGSSTIESLGGGDTLYTTDTSLVKTALGTLVANKVGTTTATAYWLGARDYHYYSSSSWCFIARSIGTSGGIIFGNYGLLIYRSRFYTVSDSNAIRPILTLTSGIQATGSGTKDDPFVLQ